MVTWSPVDTVIVPRLILVIIVTVTGAPPPSLRATDEQEERTARGQIRRGEDERIFTRVVILKGVERPLR